MAITDLCLCIDLGTGGPKVGVVTFDGDLIAHELHHVTTHFNDHGGATQDATEWWELIRSSATRLLHAKGVDRTLVKAVAVTGQYASTVPVDEQGVPTGPCVTWLDTRGGPYSRRAIGGALQGYNARKLRRFVQRSGGAPSTSGADPVGQILYLLHEQPQICANTRWFMEPVDYLTMRFSGVATGSHASRLAMWMTDNRHLETLHYDETLLDSVGLTHEKLPTLVRAASVIGAVKPEVASELGLATSTLVVAGLPDLHAAAFGARATAPFATHMALSTTSWISCPLAKKKTDAMHSIAAVPGLTNDSYVMIDNQETGAKALEWLQHLLAGGEEPMSFEQMTALAASSPPGANGVRFTPWLAGERSPIDDKRARAGFTNLSITTTTADMIRAVMEGVAANSAWLFGYVEKFAERTLTPIRLVGGGAQSDLWCQIIADALDREVHQVTSPMTAQLRGMALAASVSLGYRSLDQVDDVALSTRVFEPVEVHAELYRGLVKDLAGLYQRDKKWSRRAAKI